MNASWNDTIKYLNDLNQVITFYYMVLSSAIGLPANLLSAYIFARLITKTNKTNMGLLCFIQSVFDFFFLLTQLFVIRSSPLIFPQPLFNATDLACKFISFLRRFVIHASCAVTLLTTIDRFLMVRFRHRLRITNRKRFLLSLLMVMLLVILIVDFPHLFFYLSNNSTCTSSKELIIATDLMAISFRTYIPFLAMVIMTSLMVRTLRRSSRQFDNRSSKSQRQHQFTMVVIAYDTFFFACSFPISIFFILNCYYVYTDAFTSDPVLAATYNLLYGIMLDISYCKQVLTFFMNVSLNKVFRKRMIGIFKPALSSSH